MIIFIDYAFCTYVLFLLSGINLEGNIKQFPFEYSIQHNFARPKHFRGSNTMYSRKRSSFFFLLSPDIDSLKIVTNHPDKPIAILSSSTKPNFNFLIARFVSGILKFLNWVDQPCKDKIFLTVRRHLLSQFTALKARQHSSVSNLNQTKTYFRFSHKRQTIYFGFYLPCMSQSSCVTPCCFITKSQQLCFSHSLVQQSLSSKCINQSIAIANQEFKTKLKQKSPKNQRKLTRLNDKPWRVPKAKISRRLGIVYSKTLTPNSQSRPDIDPTSSLLPVNFRLWVVQYDTRIIPNTILSSKQLARHRRLGIFSSKFDPNIPNLLFNINNKPSKSPAIRKFSSSIGSKLNNSTFRLLHRHLHTPYFHNEKWKKPFPSQSLYYGDILCDSSLPPELISLFNRTQFKPQPQPPSSLLSEITRDNLLDQSFSNPNSPWYVPRGTDPFLDSDRLYAKSLVKDLVSLISQDVHFDQIQAPSGLAFTPTSPTIQPDICSDLILDQIDESSYFPFGPQSNPMG